MPALNFSNSYSFNEKILFMKDYEEKPELVAVGSSMTLNNLYSEVVIENMKTTKYLNTASWGSSMDDNFYFIQLFTQLYNPKSILIVSNMTDFHQEKKEVNYDWVENYLQSNYFNTIKYAIRDFDKGYYVRSFEYVKKVRFCANNDYECLNYDNYGMVAFDTTNFTINKERWIKEYFNETKNNSQYLYLDSISDYCKEKNIKLLFFDSPVREGLKNTFDEEKKNIQSSHIQKIKNSIEKNGHIFIDSSEKQWADSLFVDAIHFNQLGAKVFTTYCFSKIEK